MLQKKMQYFVSFRMVNRKCVSIEKTCFTFLSLINFNHLFVPFWWNRSSSFIESLTNLLQQMKYQGQFTRYFLLFSGIICEKEAKICYFSSVVLNIRSISELWEDSIEYKNGGSNFHSPPALLGNNKIPFVECYL